MKVEKTARPTDRDFVLETFVPFRLSCLASRITREVSKAYMRRFRLGAPEWRIVAVLGGVRAAGARNVAECTGMDKVRMSRAITRLLGLGLITRRTDASDRRRVVLELTSSGRSVYHGVVPRARAVEQAILSVLGSHERAQLDAILTKLEERMNCSPALADDRRGLLDWDTEGNRHQRRDRRGPLTRASGARAAPVEYP